MMSLSSTSLRPRHFDVAPADVDPRGLGGDVGQRLVERLDIQLHLPAEVLQRPGAWGGHGQVRAIQLEDEARAVDRLVFLSHRRASALRYSSWLP